MRQTVGACKAHHLQPVALLSPRPLLRRAFPCLPAARAGSELRSAGAASRLVVRRRCQEDEQQQQQEGKEEEQSNGGGGDGEQEKRAFLSLEEAGLVEMSGLSTHERFLCRLTVSVQFVRAVNCNECIDNY
ncbi:hypothetical protein E2562_004330 [Oryza meyeriana var. granulata]|uniref:Uncharacterized protein n=1 Tax=Oryza meyeriana var. granulata TaxID=110450 RepID=A0A6G1BSL1_9ORYZ|nr:hypothetical protein E2562_004330 [Oryza meyeriana var. granulata]